MSGSKMNYRFGSKNNWRRWQWNRISERITDRSSAIVVYLSGSADLDSTIAIERGFLHENLISVEANAGICRQIRRGGRLCLHGDLLEVLVSFPYRIHVLVADFCSGLEARYLDYLSVWISALPTLRDAVVAVNFQRGRDASSNVHRSQIIPDPQWPKHRGDMFATSVCLDALFTAEGRLYHEDGIFKFRDEIRFSAARRQAVGEELAKRMSIANFSYRSAAGVNFDGSVFTAPLRGVPWPGIDEYDRHVISAMRNGRHARSAAAVMAHRTRRLQS